MSAVPPEGANDAAEGAPDPARDEAELTCDALLGGRVRLWQPARGYRAATDPVFLAAACPAEPGARVLDMGCGAGAAALCLAARAPRLEIHGVELQPSYADLARRNAALNDATLTVHEGDVAAPPEALKALVFDHVIANPPYFRATDAASPTENRDTARRAGPDGVAQWVDAGLRRLRQGGWLTIIHRAERLDAILAALSGRAGAVEILPISARRGRAAGRVIIRARKDRRGSLRLAWPFIVHAGHAHEADAEDFTDAAKRVLRDGASLSFDAADA